VLKRWS